MVKLSPFLAIFQRMFSALVAILLTMYMYSNRINDEKLLNHIAAIKEDDKWNSDVKTTARLITADEIAKITKRPLYVINFSVNSRTLDLSSEDGQDKLMHFLTIN